MRITDALADPKLFADHFEAPSWRPWKAFVAALEAAPLDEDAFALYRHHTGRSEAPTVPFREAALICGRRGGKTRTLALIATAIATLRDWTPYLAAGEFATVAIIATDRKQARNAMRFVRGFLKETALLAREVTNDEADAIELGKKRVVIEVHTCSLRSVRGYSFAAVLADECAFWRDDTSANPDTEVLAALRPGLSNLPGSLLLLASSPYAKRGELYRAFREHWGRDDARVLVWRGSTLEMNSALDPSIVERAYEDDPASAAAEFGAEFRNDIAAFVTREVVEACTPPGRFELPYLSTHRYVAFVDPSGGSSDSMTLAVAHDEAGVGVLDALREVRPPFSPESVVREFCDLLKAYKVMKVTGDRYAGEWPRERFREHGITYEVGEKPKSDLYRDLLPLLNSGKVELLDERRLAAQMCGLERRTARGGRDSIDHSPGAHDDIANAAAGALLLSSSRKAMVISDDVLARARAMRPLANSPAGYRRRAMT